MHTLTLRLELRVDDDALSGELADSDGTAHAFSGRLELLAAIEAAIAATTPTGAAPTSG